MLNNNIYYTLFLWSLSGIATQETDGRARQQRPTPKWNVMKSRISRAHPVPVLSVPRGKEAKLTFHPSILTVQTSKLAEKSDTSSSRLQSSKGSWEETSQGLNSGQSPLMLKSGLWLPPRTDSVLPKGEQNTNVVFEVLLGGLITGLIQRTNCLPVFIKDSDRCVTDLGVKGQLGSPPPPRDDSPLAYLKHWLKRLVV